MNIIVNSDRTVEKEYTEKDGSQNENRVTELNFTLPEEYSGEGFVPKIAFITEDGNFSDYIDNGKYILKNNITKYREVICFVWLTDSVNNIDFRSQTFPLEFYYNEDPSDYIPSEQEKSQIELLMEELDEKIQEVTELEENVYTKDETYSKSETYSKEETYNKQEIDSKVSSVYKYKRTVATYNNLPSTGLTIGDVYNVEDTGDNYAWTGTDWDKLGGNIDLSGYQEKIDNSHKLNADLVDDSNSTNKFTNTVEKNTWNAKYTKPNTGIPKADLSDEVKASLNKADSAVQDISGKEDTSNKVTLIDENSTDEEYTSAKAVYNELVKRDEEIENLKSKNAQLIADHPDIEETGTDLTLEGTGDLKMKALPGGNSTQITTTGKNKLAPAEEYTATNFSITTTSDGKGNYTLKGTSTGAGFIRRAYIENYTIQEGDYVHLKNKGIIGTSAFVLMLTDGDITIIPNTENKIFDLSSYIGKTIYATNFYVNNDNTMDISLSPMIVNSSTVTDFEEYTGGQASPNPIYPQAINNVEGNVKVKAENRELFDGKFRVGTININENYTNTVLERILDYSNLTTLYYIFGGYFKAGTYTLSVNLENFYISLNRIAIAGTQCVGSTAHVRNSYTWTQAVDGYTYFSIERDVNENDYTDTNFNGIDFKLSIVEGSVAKPYVPYAENIATFPLAEGQKLMLGDYLADDGIYHKRIKLRINSNQLEKPSDTQNVIFVRLNNYKGINGLCTHFTNALKSTINNNENANIYLNDNEFNFRNNILDRVYFKNSNFTSLADWINFFNNNEVYLEYELSEEAQKTAIEPYTPEQQTAYNKLKEMQSYYDLTYVVGSSNNAQPILTAHAKKSLKVMQSEIDNINSRLTLLEE